MDRLSSPELHGDEHRPAHDATFEETYPQHEFAELVRLALAVGAWLANMRRRVEGGRLDMPGRPLPGDMSPAE